MKAISILLITITLFTSAYADGGPCMKFLESAVRKTLEERGVVAYDAQRKKFYSLNIDPNVSTNQLGTKQTEILKSMSADRDKFYSKSFKTGQKDRASCFQHKAKRGWRYGRHLDND